ncbi:polysaccharide deacetylase family protein [Paenibacillus sp. MBLB4367]|uniref:polysaccharide deacetylase family protein n=1 Tax=Paenibacillus sp. MBLB4367 TaxID=3384767 RepID=UPI0039083980
MKKFFHPLAIASIISLLPACSSVLMTEEEKKNSMQPTNDDAKIVLANQGTNNGPVSAEPANQPAASPAPSETPSPAPTASPTPTPVPTPSPTATPLPKQFIRYENQVIVLMYHHIAENEAGEEITITPDRFSKHMQALKDNHYQVVSIEDYIDYIKHDKKLPPNAVVITFDDGYESYYKYAYPVMKKHGFTGTNFLVLSYVDVPYPQLPFMNWEQVKEMKRDGFSFYSHTYNLHRKGPNEKGELVPALQNPLFLEQEKRMETDAEYRQRLRDDLTKANEMLEKELGNQLKVLCFPYGAYNKTVVQVGNEIGIDHFFTIKEGVNNRANKEVLRINAGTRYVSAEKLMVKMDKFKQPVKK